MAYLKKLILPIYLWMYRLMMKICWNIFIHFPIDHKKIVYSNFNGGCYGGNTKYIAQEFLKRGLDWKYYWVAASDYDLPKEIRPVRPNTPAFAWHMATAGVWVDNTHKLYYYKKRPGQYYVQTMHGGPAVKKTEGDCEEFLTPEYIAYSKRDVEHIDVMLSPCQWMSDTYRRAYWYKGFILEKGAPQDDIFFEDPTPYRKKILNYFHLPADTQLIFYFPTFRDSRRTDMYNLDYEQLLATMKKRFGGDWAVLVRMHPNIDPSTYRITYTDRILDSNVLEDMQELVAVCDVLISDYSGVTFDFLLQNKPVFLYAEDYEEMKQGRGFYHDLNELPFPLCLSNEELMAKIESFDLETYQRKGKEMWDGFGLFDDGHASESIVNLILEVKKPYLEK